MGRFVGAFVGVLEGLKTGKSTIVGPVVGDLVGALVGPLVGPLVVPLVGRGSLSPALCVAHSGNSLLLCWVGTASGPFWKTISLKLGKKWVVVNTPKWV